MKKSEFVGRITSYNKQLAEELWDEIHDAQDTLVIWNVPEHLIQHINIYNARAHQDAINITEICVNALVEAYQNKMKSITLHSEEAAGEMEEGPEDINGVELKEGDKVEFNISSLDAYNHHEGIIGIENGEYIVYSGNGSYVGHLLVDDNLLDLRKISTEYLGIFAGITESKQLVDGDLRNDEEKEENTTTQTQDDLRIKVVREKEDESYTMEDYEQK